MKTLSSRFTNNTYEISIIKKDYHKEQRRGKGEGVKLSRQQKKNIPGSFLDPPTKRLQSTSVCCRPVFLFCQGGCVLSVFRAAGGGLV